MSIRNKASFALWVLFLAMVAAFGSAVHGGYDLANALNPPAAANADLPSQVDPRGLLTFGVASIALFVISWLIVGSGKLPRSLGVHGHLTVDCAAPAGNCIQNSSRGVAMAGGRFKPTRHSAARC